MRTLFSSQRRCIIAVAVILFTVIIGWLIFSSPPSNTLTIFNAGVEQGHGNAVGFWVTNTTHRPVYLVRFRVQNIQEGDWTAEFENQPPVLAEKGAPQSSYSLLTVAPGEYRKVLVTPSTNAVWRAGLVYTSESKGIRALITRIRLAVIRRDLSLLRGNVWAPYRTTFSAAITNAPPKR